MPGLLSWSRCTATFPVSGRCPGQDGRGPAGPGRSVPGAPQPRGPGTCLPSGPRKPAEGAGAPGPPAAPMLLGTGIQDRWASVPASGHTNCPAGGADPEGGQACGPGPEPLCATSSKKPPGLSLLQPLLGPPVPVGVSHGAPPPAASLGPAPGGGWRGWGWTRTRAIPLLGGSLLSGKGCQAPRRSPGHLVKGPWLSTWRG